MRYFKSIVATVLVLLFTVNSISIIGADSKYVPNKDIKFKKVFDLSNGGKKEDNPDQRMAHNIYSDPDLSKTSGKFNGFLIDFKADYAPIETYWALCNFWLDLSDLQKKNTIIESGGAYCGLQNTVKGKKAIMSFWDIKYKTKKGVEKTLTPSLVYPVMDGDERFGGEGTGAHYLSDYEWKVGKWYRMYIRSYTDKKSGNTFVDMYFKELDGGKWTKICTYDTKLKNSCFYGSMSQFMENYYYESCSEIRSFEYRNIYVRDVNDNKWKNVTQSRLSVDTYWDNKCGTFAFGSTSTCLWGITCGYGKDSAKLNEDIHSVEKIKPTAKPKAV